MKKQIAVLMCAIVLDNQRELFNGMIEAAKEMGCNLYFFANYINFSEKSANVEGAYHILKLPDFKEFDGAIIVKNLIRHKETAEYVTKALRDSGIPAVSVDVEIPGMSWIGVSTYEAQMEIVEHLITKHNCKEIYYVSGPLVNSEGRIRYQAYCDTLEKYSLEYKEENVYYGYFGLNSGRIAGEKFLKNGKCPQAVVCANDDMARGLVEFLIEKGYRIPEDVKITGFDDGEFSKIHIPSLTTISKKQKEIGYFAVHGVLSLIEGNPVRKQYISCQMKLRRSCGCKTCDEINLEMLRKSYMKDKILTQRSADMIRNMSSDFSGMETPEELVESLKKFMFYIPDMDAFYLCFCDKEKIFIQEDDNLIDSPDIGQINVNYTKEITIPMAYERGEFKTYKAFPKGKVLPDECRNESGGNYFIISPINYQRICFGYTVIKNSRFPADNALYYLWVVNIGISLENIRKWMLLKNTVVKLNNVWAYDMMTHLYNRAGFYHNVDSLIKQMQEKDQEVFLIFMDADGLKQANDTMGHEMGDWMIREMAEVIKENLSENQIAMRYGGDEFVILGSVENREQLEKLPDKLRASMKNRSMQNNNLFELKASIGMSIYRAKEIKNLDTLIEDADKKMYEEKRSRKAQLGIQQDTNKLT